VPDLRGHGRTLVQISFLGNDRKRGVQPPHRSCQRFDRGEPIITRRTFLAQLAGLPFFLRTAKADQAKECVGRRRSAFPFSPGLVLSDPGHEVRIFLLAEATPLMRKATANAILPVGWPPLSETLEKLVARHV
jgi:hypothetical protein